MIKINDYYIDIENKYQERAIFPIFLCGSFSEKNIDRDKRKIFGELISKNLSDNTHLFIPITPEKNFKSIQEMGLKDDYENEKILSEFAAAIIIFLETFSSAAEVGIFSNISDDNADKSLILYPKYPNVKNVRYNAFFIDKYIIKNKNILYYDAEFIESSTEVIDSGLVNSPFNYHLYFKNNSAIDILNNNKIQEYFDKIKNKKINFSFYSANNNSKFIASKITYKIINKEKKNICINFYLEHYLYLILSILASSDLLDQLNEFSEIPDNSKIFISRLARKIISIINVLIKNTFIQFSKKFKKIDDNFNEWTFFHRIKFYNKSILVNDFIVYILVFLMEECKLIINNNYKIIVNNEYNDLLIKLNILKKQKNENELILKKTNLFLNENIKNFNLDFIENGGISDKFFKTFEIKKKGKVKTIVSYKDKTIKNFHNKLIFVLDSKLPFNLLSLNKKDKIGLLSFAYKNEITIKDLLNKHRNNSFYLKFDIQEYFNSISHDKLLSEIKKIFIKDINYDILNQLFKMTIPNFIKNKGIPIGLASSPFWSELFLIKFDNDINSFLTNEFSDLGPIYTRYADDIIISFPKTIGKDKILKINEKIWRKLHYLSLKTNKLKTKIFELTDNNFIKIFKIIIQKDKPYRVTRKYLDYTFYKLKIFINNNNMSLKKEIIGKYSYANFINSNQLINYLNNRLKQKFISFKDFLNYLNSINNVNKNTNLSGAPPLNNVVKDNQIESKDYLKNE